uniref:hypothetical protein n=1 Tax=Flavobacterium sp. TaxID=239 RepID=UPI004049C581
MFSQSQVTLVLRNGDTLRGYCKINKKEKIVFTKSMDDKKRIFDHKEVKQAIIYENGKIITYEYKFVQNYIVKNNILLIAEPFIKGKISLHKRQVEGYNYSPSFAIGPDGMFTSMVAGGGYYETTMYFVSNGTPDNVTYLSDVKTDSKRFKELAVTIFGDCPDLMEKINNDFFGKEGTVEIVEYYNEHCGN